MGKSTCADGTVVPADGRGLVSSAGAVLLRETMRAAVLARAACQPGWLKIYAHRIDSQATAANQRIAIPSAPRTPRKTPATRKTTTSSRHPEMAGQGGNPDGSV